MDIIKSNLISNALCLLLKHNIKQRTIFSWIRDAIEEEAKHIPRIKVLFNNCHGGFDYSADFEHFLKQYNTDICIFNKELRVANVKYVKPFGKLMVDTFPDLRDLIYIYHMYQMDLLVEKIANLNDTENKLENLKVNYNSLRQYFESPDSVFCENGYNENYVKPFIHTLHLKTVDYSTFAKKDLQHLLDLCLQDLPQKQLKKHIMVIRDEIIGIIGNDEETFDDLLHYFTTSRDSSTYRRNNSFISFIDSARAFGVLEEKTWMNQFKYNEMCIKYLIKKKRECWWGKKTPEDISHIYDFFVTKNLFEIDHEILEDVYHNVGLLCAGSEYSDICVATLPALVDWDIKDYDGKENVYIL